MSLIAMVTDTHCGVRNDNPVFHQHQKKCWDWFFDIIDEKQIKHVIHLGDIYDRRKYINFMSAKRLREDLFDRIEERQIEMHIIQGNHDSFFKNTHEVNALDELVGNRYKYIKTYSVPEIINIDGLDIQIMPWITESNIEAAMDAINNPRADILMGHLELSGFQMHKGVLSDHGLDRKVFDKFDRVYSGHYHHRSTIGNVSYIGAFSEYTWSDYNDPRGFSTFDTERRDINFIQNPHTLFKMVEYDDVKNPSIAEQIHSTISDLGSSFVKLVVHNKTNPNDFDVVFDSICKAGPIDVNIVEDPSVLLESEDQVDVDQAEDTPTILRKYISSLTLPVDKTKMKKFIIDVYNEALQSESV